MSHNAFTLLKCKAQSERERRPFPSFGAAYKRYWHIPALNAGDAPLKLEDSFTSHDVTEVYNVAEERCRIYRESTGKRVYPVLDDVEHYFDRVLVRLGDKAAARASILDQRVVTRIWNVIPRTDPISLVVIFFGQIIINGERISICSTRRHDSRYTVETIRDYHMEWSNINYFKELEFINGQIEAKRKRDELAAKKRSESEARRNAFYSHDPYSYTQSATLTPTPSTDFINPQWAEVRFPVFSGVRGDENSIFIAPGLLPQDAQEHVTRLIGRYIQELRLELAMQRMTPTRAWEALTALINQGEIGQTYPTIRLSARELERRLLAIPYVQGIPPINPLAQEIEPPNLGDDGDHYDPDFEDYVEEDEYFEDDEELDDEI